MSDLGLILCQRAIQVGFDRLTASELAEVVRHEDAQLERLDGSHSADAMFRSRLHVGIRHLAKTAIERRERR